jgi:hypothetical protein
MLNKQTTLDLNGPILSFTTNPVGVASTGVAIESTGGGSVTLTGIATASFITVGIITNRATNTGYVTYLWHEVGVGALEDSTYVTGTATTSLTLTNLITPTDNQRQFYLTADYVPSAYGLPDVAVTVGSARSTGNAIIEPISSGIATVTVYPNLEIVAQPSNRTIAVNQNATFTVNGGLTDDLFANDIVYQWYWNGTLLTQDSSTITSYATVNVTTTTTTYVQQQQTFYREVSGSSNRSENRTFSSDGSIDLPDSSYDVIVRVAGGAGGRGGDDAGGPGGSGGAGRFGRFFYNSGGRTLSFRIGRRGSDGGSGKNTGSGNAGYGGADGGRGGNSGGGIPGAYSGGGGGGGGATVVYDNRTGRQTITAAGGSGGGGGSLDRGGSGGSNAGGFGGGPIALLSRGSDGQDGDRDGGGGGGSGGGSGPVGSGGQNGIDEERGGSGGGQTFGSYDSGQMYFPFDGTENYGDGYVQVEYKWTESFSYQEPYTGTVTVPVVTETTTTRSVQQNTYLSGAFTPTLTVRADFVGIGTAQCKISSASSTNSPIFSEVAQFVSLSTAEQYNINVETIGNTNTAGSFSTNLFNGEYTFVSSTEDLASQIILYAPDRDVVVEMDLYGGKGTNVGSYVGGEGGFSRIRFTIFRNTEYVITGLFPSVNTPFIYRKGQLIACVGGGGNAGTSGNGGFGGGVRNAGQSGFGRNSGSGGASFAAGTLPSNGIFGSLTSLTATSPDTKAVSPNGGRVLPCTKGVYWKNQGYAACQDIGTSQFRLSNGTLVTNTASITRGFKAGYSIITTSGAGTNNGGNGGNGAAGGNGGAGGAGGGGGSGYTDGSVTIVSSQLGGSTGTAKVIIRSAA